jgi:hypothetical protein
VGITSRATGNEFFLGIVFLFLLVDSKLKEIPVFVFYIQKPMSKLTAILA